MTKTYWRLYCKTEKQDGTQGTKIAAKSKKYYVVLQERERKWAEGYYLDTDRDPGREQIRAHPLRRTAGRATPRSWSGGTSTTHGRARRHSGMRWS